MDKLIDELNDITKQLHAISVTVESNKRVLDKVLNHNSLTDGEKKTIEQFFTDVYTTPYSSDFKGYGINAFLISFKQYLDDNDVEMLHHKNLRAKLKEVLGKPQKGTKWIHLEMKDVRSDSVSDTVSVSSTFST